MKRRFADILLFIVTLAELAILENLGAAELLRFVSASPEERERSLETVILRGGLCDLRGRFVEVAG